MYEDFISFADLTRGEIEELLTLADDLKKRRMAGDLYQPLRGKTIGMLFEKPSLRTRVTFETGIYQLGGHAVFMEMRLGERETVPDIARNLERWVDGIVARTHSHDSVLELAAHGAAPVINALTDRLHPCQVLADAMTLREKRGSLEGVHVAFVGDGNNVFASWAELAACIPIRLTLVCPAGYELKGPVHTRTQEMAGSRYQVTHDLETGVRGADVIYTDVWTSMGQEAENTKRQKAFRPYQVNRRVMELAGQDSLFMHCLPAHRGEEVTDEVIESGQSIVFDEAENRLHAQKAVMFKLMK
jgi:ornithine carbamoyltransferase